MEFERALFRIHTRTLESDEVRKVRLRLEKGLPWAIAILVLSLALLHIDYVGQARCLPAALQHAGLWNATAAAPAFPEDALLALKLVEGDEILDISLHMSEASDGPATTQPSESVTIQGEGVSLSSQNATIVKIPAKSTSDPRGVISSYRFAIEKEVLVMRSSIFEKHLFKVYNLSVTERCLAPSHMLSDSFRLFDAFDGIIINELAYTFRSRGYLERIEGSTEVESWAWSEDQVEDASPRGGRSLLASAARKAMILCRSLITVFLISALTGLFIRVALNGSAVLMFPITVVAQSLGVSSGRMSMGMLTRSFPWVGVHVEVLRRAGQPLWPLFRSHLIFLFLQSFAYLACNLAWRILLYRKSSPEGFEEHIFSLCSFLELFNLLFVRSTGSAAVFPKLTMACMVWLHFYVFCSLYPFHVLALATCAAACAYVMVYCLNHFEEPALRADSFDLTTPTAAHPRSLYMPQLSPSWTLESAPLWTMFYPPEPPDAYREEAMRHIQSEEYLMP